MNSSSLARFIAGSALAAVLAAAPIEISAKAPSPEDISGLTAAGAYLAARHAGRMRDAITAAEFYRAALAHDPKNTDLLDRTFLSLLIGGEIPESVKYARRVVHIDKDDHVARLVLGVHAIKERHYAAARRDLLRSVRGPITDLTATLLAAWAEEGTGNVKHAVALLDRLSGPDWYTIFKDLHAGMMLDITGHKKEAGKRLEAAYKLDSSALRVVEAYGSWLSRNESPKAALAIFETFNKTLPQHPLVVQAMKKLKAGEKLPPLVANAEAGAAEALYGLGASLGRRGGEDLGLVYLQLALYLQPRHSLALLSLGDLYEQLQKPDLALKIYARVPASSPLHRNALIQMAADLDTLNRPEEAKKHLETLLKEHPDDQEVIMALGNVLREHKEFTACADVYSKGIALVPHPDKSDWLLYYFRGICYERANEWPKAEADLKEALKLFPDQPHVLNYLGYSWIDKGTHLDQGMAMIKRAVAQRPDDGYIVDSLGWAYYRLGNYQEAVKQLQRAVELKPEDPTINDHFGDALWRVGRTLEAKFQWMHARDFKPAPEELAKIELKLKNGLPAAAGPAKTTKSAPDKPAKPEQAKATKPGKKGDSGG